MYQELSDVQLEMVTGGTLTFGSFTQTNNNNTAQTATANAFGGNSSNFSATNANIGNGGTAIAANANFTYQKNWANFKNWN